MNGEEVIKVLLVEIKKIRFEALKKNALYLCIFTLGLIFYIFEVYIKKVDVHLATLILLALYIIFFILMVKNVEPIWDKRKSELGEYIYINSKDYSGMQQLLEVKIIELENKKLKIPFKDFFLVILSVTISGLYFEESQIIAIYNFIYFIVIGYLVYLLVDLFNNFSGKLKALKDIKEIFFEIDIKNRNYSKKIGHKNFIRKTRNRRDLN